MKHHRQRVAHDLRARLAEIFTSKVSDPRLSGLTVSEVRVSPDLSIARVFYLPGGDPETAAAGIARAAPFVRRCLAEGLRLRRVPELVFQLDESMGRAQRIEELLRDVKAEKSGQAADDPTKEEWG